jgi:hypothetical protein
MCFILIGLFFSRRVDEFKAAVMEAIAVQTKLAHAQLHGHNGNGGAMSASIEQTRRLVIQAGQLIDTFVVQGSPYEINISAQLRQSTTQALIVIAQRLQAPLILARDQRRGYTGGSASAAEYESNGVAYTIAATTQSKTTGDQPTKPNTTRTTSTHYTENAVISIDTSAVPTTTGGSDSPIVPPPMRHPIPMGSSHDGPPSNTNTTVTALDSGRSNYTTRSIPTVSPSPTNNVTSTTLGPPTPTSAAATVATNNGGGALVTLTPFYGSTNNNGGTTNSTTTTAASSPNGGTAQSHHLPSFTSMTALAAASASTPLMTLAHVFDDAQAGTVSHTHTRAFLFISLTLTLFHVIGYSMFKFIKFG